MWGELARRVAWVNGDADEEATVVEERPAPPKDLVEFTAACDVCGIDVTWHGGLSVIKDPNGHGTLTVSESWTDHCAEVAA